MGYNIYLDNTKPEDLISKNAKQNLKNVIKKALKSEEDNLEVLNNLKSTLLERYYVKQQGFDNTLSLKIDDEKNEIRLYFDRELNTEEYKKVEAAKNREKLRKKLHDKLNSKKNVMTQQQYMKKMKSEKKMLNKDPRVTEDMIKKYNLLRQSMPQAQFPNPVDMLDKKDEHMQNFFKYIIMTKQYVGDDEAKMVEMCNNDYSRYVGAVYNIRTDTLIKSILKIHEAQQKKEKAESTANEKTEPQETTANEKSEEPVEVREHPEIVEVETNENQDETHQLDSTQMMELTGGDTISARSNSI